MDINKYITVNSYNITAVEYQERVSTFENLPYLQVFIDLVKKNGEILDLGCGPGLHAKVFSEAGLKVTGIDLSSAMIELAHKNSPTSTFYVMDIEELTLPPSSFNGIWASASLLHLNKSKIFSALEKIFQILKPAGFFYFSLKKGEGEHLVKDSRYLGVEKFYSYFSANEIRQFISKTKFKIILFEEIPKRFDYDNHAWLHVILQK